MATAERYLHNDAYATSTNASGSRSTIPSDRRLAMLDAWGIVVGTIITLGPLAATAIWTV